MHLNAGTIVKINCIGKASTLCCGFVILYSLLENECLASWLIFHIRLFSFDGNRQQNLSECIIYNLMIFRKILNAFFWHENCYPKGLCFWYLAAFGRHKMWLGRKKFTPILENLFFIKGFFYLGNWHSEQICGDAMESISVFINCKFAAYCLIY